MSSAEDILQPLPRLQSDLPTVTNMPPVRLVAGAARPAPATDGKVVVAIGASHGRMLFACLEEDDTARGVLFERPGMIEDAERALLVEPEAHRVEIRTGDLLHYVPADADLYIMQDVLPDWNDGQCLQIFDNLAIAMKPDSRLLIAERFDDRPQEGLRTEAQLRAMLDRADLEVLSTSHTPTGVSVLMVVPR